MSDYWLQHVNVKFPAVEAGGAAAAAGGEAEAAGAGEAGNGAVDLAQAIPVFHRWIQQQALPGLLIDVADYRHVPEGPGVVLVAHEALYGLDQGGGRLGLLYNRRTRIDAPPAEALQQAFRAALEACRKLEQEPEFAGTLSFAASACEVAVNDRALAPNDAATAARLRAALQPLLDHLWGSGSYQMNTLGEARDRLGVTAHTGTAHSVGVVLDKL